MGIFLLIIEIFLIIIAIILGLILCKHIYSNIMDQKSEERLKNYTDNILEMLLKDEKGKLIKDKIDSELIEALVIIINSIRGDMRRKLIKMINNEKIINHVYKKYKQAKYKYKKEYYLYSLGELRHKKVLNNLLSENLEKIKKNRLLVSYFFALVSIVDEWIFILEDKKIYKYLDRLLDIVEIMEGFQSWNTKRLMDYFLNGTDKFFIFTVENYKYIDYFIEEIYNREMSLELKGEIIYIISLNREYRIVNFIEKEFYKYIGKDRTRSEKEYLIKMIKSLTSLGLESSNDLFLVGVESDDWVIRSESVKGLSNFEKNMDLIYLTLFDDSWWVRYNSAMGISNFGIIGRSTLFFALKSETNDNYAKEVSAYVLVDQVYLEMVKKLIATDGFDMILGEILLIINEGNNMQILDAILKNNKLDMNKKINIISKVTSYKLYEYYDNILQYSNKIDDRIKEEIEKKRGEKYD